YGRNWHCTRKWPEHLRRFTKQEQLASRPDVMSTGGAFVRSWRRWWSRGARTPTPAQKPRTACLVGPSARRKSKGNDEVTFDRYNNKLRRYKQQTTSSKTMKLQAAVTLLSALIGKASAIERLEDNLFTDEDVYASTKKKKNKKRKRGKQQKVDCAIVPKVESDDPDVWHGDPCFRASTIVPKCKAGTVEEISGTTVSWMIGANIAMGGPDTPDEFPTPEHKKFWGSENCSTSNHPGRMNPYRLIRDTCTIGEWFGDMNGLYGGGHFSNDAIDATQIDFKDSTPPAPPGPHPGNPGITFQRGSNWVYTDICNKRKGSNKPEWINFDTVMTGTSSSFPLAPPPPPRSGNLDDPNFDWDQYFNDRDFDWDQWFEYFRSTVVAAGSNNYNLNTENSQGCDGFHISFILATKRYWNEETKTTGCGEGACAYSGYICEIE
ncbi:hypothetical protein THAOC_24972, partial [Thalassiosira oceanica]